MVLHNMGGNPNYMAKISILYVFDVNIGKKTHNVIKSSLSDIFI